MKFWALFTLSLCIGFISFITTQFKESHKNVILQGEQRRKLSLQQIKVQDSFLTCTISVIVAPITIEMRQNRKRFEMSRFILILFLIFAWTPAKFVSHYQHWLIIFYEYRKNFKTTKMNFGDFFWITHCDSYFISTSLCYTSTHLTWLHDEWKFIVLFWWIPNKFLI